MSELYLGHAAIKREGDTVSFDGYYEGESIKLEIPEIEVLEHSPYYDKCPPRPTTQFECPCGSKAFTVHYKAGGYETSVICMECGDAFVVHEG